MVHSFLIPLSKKVEGPSDSIWRDDKDTVPRTCLYMPVISFSKKRKMETHVSQFQFLLFSFWRKLFPLTNMFLPLFVRLQKMVF